MKSKVLTIVTIINVIALAILFWVWWTNGREDTWFYILAALIVVSSFWYAKKDVDKR